MENEKQVIIIGAGPAGLGVAWYLLKNSDIKPIIFETSTFIGGISSTREYSGNRMDLGGHRFFTKDDEVMKMWEELCPIQSKPSKDDFLLEREFELNPNGNDPNTTDKVFLKRRRVSRIYFLKKFFNYPITLNFETLKNLGFINVLKVGFGYLFSLIKKRKENSLEDFYVNRFGKPLYEMFFENYTQKVFGIHPSKIAPDWGAQRVKGLSIIKIILNCLFKPFLKKKDVETSLIEEFYYPKLGPGQLYEIQAEEIQKMGGKIFLEHEVIKVNLKEGKINSVEVKDKEGKIKIFEAQTVFSSMPIKNLITSFNEVDENIKKIAIDLPYRDFITVGLVAKKFAIQNTSKLKSVNNIIPDCWIYIQERDVKLGRLQIFNNWSPYMVKNFENTVSMGLEYFSNEGDELWNMSKDDFIKMAIEELSKIGLINPEDVLLSELIKVKKAYPSYFGSYSQFDTVKNYLNQIENLYCIGRNGQHRYNNMDHSILTGLEAAKAFLNGSDKSKIWAVNTEKEYHEQK